jgi:hypothetical protein
VTLFYSASYRTGWSSSNAPHLYSRGARFDSRSEHRVCWLKYFVVIRSLQENFRIVSRLGCDRVLPDPFHFMSFWHPTLTDSYSTPFIQLNCGYPGSSAVFVNDYFCCCHNLFRVIFLCESWLMSDISWNIVAVLGNYVLIAPTSEIFILTP